MLTHPHEAMLDIYIFAVLVSRQSGFITSFAITERLIECRALLFEVQCMM